MDSFQIGDISYHDFQGTTTDKKERQDIVDSLGPTNKAFILRNHGLIALGETLESAYQLMHDMMAACQIQVHKQLRIKLGKCKMLLGQSHTSIYLGNLWKVVSRHIYMKNYHSND